MADKKDVSRRHRSMTNKIEERRPAEKTKNPQMSDIPGLYQRSILKELENTLKKKLIDRWLLWDREKLRRKYPDYTLEYIDKILPENLTKSKLYYGSDLKHMISSMEDPSMVKPTDITKYISIGISNINHYFKKKKGQFHFLICDKGTSMQRLEHDGFCSNTPVLVINGIYTHAIAYLPNDISYEVVIGFKKVANNPFHDLVKFVAKQIPDEFSPWIRSWRQNIDNVSYGQTSESLCIKIEDESIKVEDEDTNSEPVSKKVRHNDNCDKNESSILPFMHTCPMLSEGDQKMVLQRLKSLFVKDTQQQVSWKQAKLMRVSPRLSARSIKENLYMLLLHKEKYAGKDIIQLILNLSDKCDPTPKQKSNYYSMGVEQKSNYYSMGVDAICKFIREGGAYNLAIVCSSAVDSISKNEDFQSSFDSPVCIINNLSSVSNMLVRFKEEGKVIGFKKVEKNIFSEFVEFVADKIAEDDAQAWISLWKNDIHGKTVDEDVFPLEDY